MASLQSPPAPVGSLALKLSTQGSVSCGAAVSSAVSLSRDGSGALERVMGTNRAVRCDIVPRHRNPRRYNQLHSKQVQLKL